MTNRFKHDKALPKLDDVRWELIQESLRRCEGNCKDAARMVGISDRTLYREMRDRGLQNTHEKLRETAQQALDQAKGNAKKASQLLGRSDNYVEHFILRGKVSRS